MKITRRQLKRIIRESLLVENETNRYTGKDEDGAGYKVKVTVTYDDSYNSEISWEGFDASGSKKFEGTDTKTNVPNLEGKLKDYKDGDRVMYSAILDAVRKVKEGEYY